VTKGYPAIVGDEAHSALQDAAAYRRTRAAGDLYGRSLVGPIFYAICCTVAAWVSGYLVPLRVAGWLPALVYIAMFFMRRGNRPPHSFTDEKPYQSWRARHWVIIHAGCVLWSAVSTYYGWVERDAPIPFTAVLIISVMLGAALSMAFSLEPKQTALTLVFLYAPNVVLFVYEPTLRAIAVMLCIYIIYQLSSMRRLAHEYNVQIDTEYALLLSQAEVERMTRVDALTGLANRREYENVYPKAWQQAARAQAEISMLVCDIDHFKKLNDGHGHLAGDACLQHFARLVEGSFRREIDLLARIGGEEFVVVLPGSTRTDAERMAERLRMKLEQLPADYQGKSLSMTVSIGVGSADFNTDASPEATFARVDSACYEAKMGGRNRVVVSHAAAA
jgi:diguanylate cyclase (GGDEF)-like protein